MNLTKKTEILQRINESFVQNFDLINESKEKINNYLTLIGINDHYNYNNFCIDLIKTSDETLEDMEEDYYQKTPVNIFIANILEKMLKDKIKNSNISEEQKNIGLIKLELDKYMTNYTNKK
jgi:hypothetical protein